MTRFARIRLVSTPLFLTTLLLLTTAVSFGSTTVSKGSFPSVKIKNFGQMDDRFYRGGQPKEEDYQALADLGIKTVIDLRDEPTNYEKRDVESLGMRYVNIPMSDTSYPKQESVDQFMKLVNDPATGKFFVHCAGGRHRTGVMGAVYRFNNYGWNFDQVYGEMKAYDFYTRWGHGDMKKFVEDYWQGVQTKAGHVAVAATAGK
jgi:protein tyrosine phosphatase (PTP) superfamily phosphohydrolase (DUF442 family)